MKPYRIIGLLLAAAAGSVCLTAAADLQLTPAGAAAGFHLTTFATDIPNIDTIGPLGIAITDQGTMVADNLGNVRVFPGDADGQSANNVPGAQNFGYAGHLSGAVGLARVGSRYYLADRLDGKVLELASDGTFLQDVVDVPSAVGIIANPANGHLWVSTVNTGGVLFDVDPVAHTKQAFLQPIVADGLVTDGITLFVATDFNHVLGFNILTRTQIFDSGYLAGSDGIALGTGTLSGKLFVNTNGGDFWQIELGSGARVLVATGGTRGDFVTPGRNCSLLLTQTDRILRLAAPPGGCFVGEPTDLNTPGKITGGGSIDQKVRNFGFVVMSSDGRSFTGSNEFQDKAQDINLHATSITSLSVGSDHVHGHFAGMATVNGQSGYSFTVWIEDNGEPGGGVDRYRIQIQGPNGFSYDSNSYTTRGGILAKGGNIQIHKGP